MAFFTANTGTSAIKDGGNSNYITSSGIYDVTIKAAFVDVNEHNARTINFFVDYNGQDQVIYGGLRLDNNDGTPNFSADIFNKLVIIAGLDSIDNPEEGTLPIGKNGTDKDVSVLTEFCDLDVKIRIQMQYSLNNKTQAITESKVIKAFYRADGASANEIVNDLPVGTQLEKDQAYAANITYKDGLDETAVQAWIASGRGKDAKPAAPTKTPSFGAKKSFGKK